MIEEKPFHPKYKDFLFCENRKSFLFAIAEFTRCEHLLSTPQDAAMLQ